MTNNDDASEAPRVTPVIPKVNIDDGGLTQLENLDSILVLFRIVGSREQKGKKMESMAESEELQFRFNLDSILILF